MGGSRAYLVTGGSGFIGTHLIRSLLNDPDTAGIVNIDLRPYRGPADPRLTTVIADVRQPLSLHPPFAADTCFHLAAACREPGYQRHEYYDINHTGTKNVIELVRQLGVPSLIFTSTIMVYPAGDQRCDEAYPPAPDTAYGESKALAERELTKWAGGGGRLKIVRPGVVFGPGDYGNYIRMYHALKRGVFCYIGRNTTVKGSIYVKDLVACLRFLQTDQARHGLYNCVFPTPCTIGDIVRTICAVKGWRRWVPVVPYRPARALAYAGMLLNAIGLRNGVHPRRIDKLYNSTDAVPANLVQDGFRFGYDLRTAVGDWLQDHDHDAIG